MAEGSAADPDVFENPVSSAVEAVMSLDNRQVTLLVAGLCALASSHICLSVVGEHTRHWKRPREQRAICVILFMVPFFAVDAYIGLADMPGSEIAITVLDSIRACYEAWVISEFLVLLFSYMDISTSRTGPVPDAVKGKVLHNSFPLTLFLGKDMVVDRKSINVLYGLSRQFVVVRPLFSIIMCILIILDVYSISFVPWIFTVVFNVAVYLAFYSLLLFYHAFEHQLAKHNPLAKFLSVKGVVFVLFWQELLIQLLVSYNVIHAGHMPYEVRQLEGAVNNLAVCVEMLLAALLFRYSFSASEYEHLDVTDDTTPEASKARAAVTSRDGSKEPSGEGAKGASGQGTSGASATVSSEGKKDK